MMMMQTKSFSDPYPIIYTPLACRIIAITTIIIYSFIYLFIHILPSVTLITPTCNNREKYRVGQYLFFEMRNMWQAAAWSRWTSLLPNATSFLSVI